MKKYSFFLFCTIAIYFFNLSESTAEYSWKKMNGYYEHDFPIMEAQVSPDGKYIYATQPNNYNTIFKFDFETGNLIDSVKIQSKVDTTGLTLRYLTFSRNGKFAILTTILKFSDDSLIQLPISEVFDISNHNLLFNLDISKKISRDTLYKNKNNAGYFSSFTDLFADYQDSSNLFILSLNQKFVGSIGSIYGEDNNGITYFYNTKNFSGTIANCFIKDIAYFLSDSLVLMTFNEYKYVRDDSGHGIGSNWTPNSGYKLFSLSKQKVVDSFEKGFKTVEDYSEFANNMYYKNMISDYYTKKIFFQNDFKSIIKADFSNLNSTNRLFFDFEISDMDFIDTNELFFLSKSSQNNWNKAIIYQLDSQKIMYEIPIFKNFYFNNENIIVNINSHFAVLKTVDEYYDKPKSYYKCTLLKIGIDSANQLICSYFQADTSKIMQYETVSFINKSSGPISKFFWDFGDGETSNEMNPKHIYSKSGTFTVKLIAYSGLDSVSFVRTEYIIVNPLLKADFEIKQLAGIDTLALEITNKSIGNIKSYKWYFDNFTSVEKEPKIVLRKPGSYDVTLIVSDGVFSDKLTKKDYLTIEQSNPSSDYIDKYYYFSDDSFGMKCTNVKEFNNKIYLISFTPNSDLGKYNYYQLNNNFELEKQLSFPQNESVLFFDFEIKNENEILGISHANLQKSDFFSGKLSTNKVKFLNNSTNTFSNLFPDNLTNEYSFTQLLKYNNEFYLLYNFEKGSGSYRNRISNINKLENDINIVKDKNLFDQDLIYVFEYFNEILLFKNPSAFRISLYESYFPGYEWSDLSLGINVDEFKIVNDSLFSIIKIKESIGNLGLFSNHSMPPIKYNLSALFAQLDFTDNIIINSYSIVSLSLGKTLYHIFLSGLKSKIFAPQDVQFASIYNYNDSLFLAGGSYQGKSALFFIYSNKDSLQIKDKIVFQSFYGNITAITQTKDSEYFLVVENKKTHNYNSDTIPIKGLVEFQKKNNNSFLQNSNFDGIVLLKTKDLGKNANSVSYSPDLKQISNYISDEILQIKLNKELSENSTLEIYNSLGQRLIAESNLINYLNNQSLMIDLEKYANQINGNAVYFFILKNGSSIQTGKFLLK